MTLVPLEALCIVRGTEPWQVLAMVRAGLLPPPVGDSVPTDYFPPESDPPPAEPVQWQLHANRELARYRDGERRALKTFDPGRERQREQQLMRMGSAAWGAGLSFMMQGRAAEAERWLDRAARLYRHSLADAEPGSWGRSIGALKARLLAGDRAGALREARWTLELGALRASSVTALYAAALSLLVLDQDARAQAAIIRANHEFPAATAASLEALASRDRAAYEHEVHAVLRTFEERDRYLEDVPVADTVLALQVIAASRGLSVQLASSVLPTAEPQRASRVPHLQEGAT